MKRRWGSIKSHGFPVKPFQNGPADNLLFGLLLRFGLVFIPFLYLPLSGPPEFSDPLRFTERGFDVLILVVITALFTFPSCSVEVTVSSSFGS